MVAPTPQTLRCDGAKKEKKPKKEKKAAKEDKPPAKSSPPAAKAGKAPNATLSTQQPKGKGDKGPGVSNRNGKT